MIVMLDAESELIGYDNGKGVYMAQLMCDNENDLTNAGEVNGKIIFFGSIAYLIQTGKICVLSSDDNWYDTGGVLVASISNSEQTQG